jgi:hypothetical protein
MRQISDADRVTRQRVRTILGVRDTEAWQLTLAIADPVERDVAQARLTVEALGHPFDEQKYRMAKFILELTEKGRVPTGC